MDILGLTAGFFIILFVSGYIGTLLVWDLRNRWQEYTLRRRIRKELEQMSTLVVDSVSSGDEQKLSPNVCP